MARVVDPDEITFVKKQRDGDICLYGIIKKDGCQGPKSVHHIVTRGAGGSDVRENLITLCQKHHDLAQCYKIAVVELRAILTRFFNYHYEEA
jgi:hypothetical protein